MTRSFIESKYPQTAEKAGWQASLKHAFRSPLSLATYLKLDVDSAERDYGFPMLVTREFASRMVKGDWNDPLLKQVWPSDHEAPNVEGFALDPVGDLEARIAAGLLQKYRGRVLLMASGVCAIHCRYCFRRHYPYAEEPKSSDAWLPALSHIQQDASIDEVILSGGDPWMMSDSKFSQLLDRIEAIPHVRRLRVHTRMPVVLPSRITQALIERLRTSRLATWVVLHSNHAQELDEGVFDAIAKLRTSGAVVLNQAVLLRGINDTVEVLEQLCRALVNVSVIPYYLHQLDLVQGASHFAVPSELGKSLMDVLRTRLPGYAIPEYVQEIAGHPSKTPIAIADCATPK